MARLTEPQNSTRQSVYWATAAAIGRPSAPPMPMEALTSAMEELSLSAGTTSRSRAMPSGSTPMPMPWRPRPTIMGTTDEESAHTTEPTISGTEQTRSIRRLPTMSPRRPETGTQTADTSRVTVITHVAFEGVVLRICGSSAMSGVTRVCMIAAVTPAMASVATTPPGRVVGWGAPIRDSSGVYRKKIMHRTHFMHRARYMYVAWAYGRMEDDIRKHAGTPGRQQEAAGA